MSSGLNLPCYRAFLVLMLTGTLSVGILTWTQAGLQSVSMLTARCLNLSSPLCPVANAKTYAVDLAAARLFLGQPDFCLIHSAPSTSPQHPAILPTVEPHPPAIAPR